MNGFRAVGHKDQTKRQIQKKKRKNITTIPPPPDSTFRPTEAALKLVFVYVLQSSCPMVHVNGDLVNSGNDLELQQHTSPSRSRLTNAITLGPTCKKSLVVIVAD